MSYEIYESKYNIVINEIFYENICLYDSFYEGLKMYCKDLPSLEYLIIELGELDLYSDIIKFLKLYENIKRILNNDILEKVILGLYKREEGEIKLISYINPNIKSEISEENIRAFITEEIEGKNVINILNDEDHYNLIRSKRIDI